MSLGEEAPPALERLARVEEFLGRLLRWGVIISMTLLFCGIVVTMGRHPDYLRETTTLARLTKPGAAFPHTLPDVIEELRGGRGRAIMILGLLTLIATPVFRVIASIIAFSLARDRRFVIITSLVLLVLLFSFWIGRVE